MQQALVHQAVMLQEAVDAIYQQPNGFYVDATFGRGGHTRELLSRLDEQGRVLALDRDPQAAQAAAQMTDPRFSFVQAEFAQLGSLLGAQTVDGLLLDVGVSSPQLDDPQRGFSFRFDGPLDMRMDPTQGESAADFLARADQQCIAQVIRDYGEERFAVSIAKAIIAWREGGQPLCTTGDLSRLVAQAVKTREPGKDPATRTFQALRIHVNAELTQLETALESSLMVLKPHARIAVISFHSLEDRIVKQFMLKHSRFEPDRRVPFATAPAMMFEDVQRIKPTAAEIKQNPRARSAVLRVARKSDVPFIDPAHEHKARGRAS